VADGNEVAIGTAFSYGVFDLVDHCKRLELNIHMPYSRVFGDPTEWDFTVNIDEATVYRNFAQTRHLAALSKCFGPPESPFSASDAAPITYNIDVKAVQTTLVFPANELNLCSLSAEKTEKWFDRFLPAHYISPSQQREKVRRGLTPSSYERKWGCTHVCLDAELVAVQTKLVYAAYMSDVYCTHYKATFGPDPDRFRDGDGGGGGGGCSSRASGLDGGSYHGNPRDENSFADTHNRRRRAETATGRICVLLPEWHTAQFNAFQMLQQALMFGSLEVDVSTRFHDPRLHDYAAREDSLVADVQFHDVEGTLHGALVKFLHIWFRCQFGDLTSVRTGRLGGDKTSPIGQVVHELTMPAGPFPRWSMGINIELSNVHLGLPTVLHGSSDQLRPQTAGRERGGVGSFGPHGGVHDRSESTIPEHSTAFSGATKQSLPTVRGARIHLNIPHFKFALVQDTTKSHMHGTIDEVLLTGRTNVSGWQREDICPPVPRPPARGGDGLAQ
jgi:hypothetical protein